MRLKHKTLTDKIHLITTDTERYLASTFLRFQEYYESPKFKGKIFTLDEFKEWYIKNSMGGEKTGKFTYYDDWEGFNIPSYVLNPFYSGKFNPLSDKEKRFLELFEKEKEKFYVIGVNKETKTLGADLTHEIAHGLFYTDKDYREEILNVLSRYNLEKLKTELKEMKYHRDVLEDECHAYSINAVKKRGLKTKIPKGLSTQLREIYKEHLKEKGLPILSEQLIL
ncbi:Uncharacterised protein [uncultured archaeon]|nr:Uncharacterised protein [uncultured archaeon]